MIPKKIHYCWFGGEEIPDTIKKCMASWKKNLEGYELIEWNSTNFDLSINEFAAEAYQARKWAFVSDYVRLYVLYHEGGIYLDTDIEVLKPFDALLDQRAFTGFESMGTIASWIFGTEKGNPIFKTFLDYYENRSFVQADGSYDTTPNPIPLSRICKEKYGMTNSPERQNLGDITVYPQEYFCAKSVIDGKIRVTENSYTIHHFEGTWQTPNEKLMKKIKYIVFNVLGDSLYPFIRRMYRKI
jgi:glycosyltransferase